MSLRLALLLAPAIMLMACNVSADVQEQEQEAYMSGVQTERRYALSGFDAVSTGGYYDVIVTVGPRHSVRAEGDQAEIDRMEIIVDDGTLEIGRKKGERRIVYRGSRPPVTVYVTMPGIRAASLAGAGDIRIDKVTGPDFKGSISGAGDIKIGTIQAEKTDFSVAGSGNVIAAGKVGAANISIVGSGDVDLAQLVARDTKISIAGTGNVRGHATATADVSILGSGDVTISGTAKCSVSKLGSGKVRCGA